MFTFDRKSRPSAAHSPAPKPASQRPAQAPPVNPLWFQLATSTNTRAAASPEVTEERRRYFEPILPAPSRVPWSRIGGAASGADAEAEASPPVAPGPQFDFARIPVMPPPVQRKATVSSPGDPFEREADAAADAVMRMATPALSEAEPRAHPAPMAQTSGGVDIQSSGAPLAPSLRRRIEPVLDADLGHVRVHSDAAANRDAAEIQARAFTHQNHIFLGRGQKESDLALMSHEAAHVVQQGAGRVGHVLQRQPGSGEVGEKYVVKTPQGGNLLLRVQPTPDTVLNGDRAQPNTVGNVRSGTVVLVKEARLYDWYVVEAETIEQGVRVGFVHKKYLHPVTAEASAPEKARAAPERSVGPSMDEVLGASETVPHQGDPLKDPSYIENSTKAIGIPIWGGPLYLKQTDAPGWNDCVVLPRNEVALVDPLATQEFKIMSVYRTREAALKAVQQMGVAGAFTFYLGPQSRILPTIVSATTAPAVTHTAQNAIMGEREDAKAAEKLGISLLLWYIGARYPAKVSEGPAATQAARSSLATILGDTEYALLKAAAEAAKQANPRLASLTIDEIIAIRAYSGESWSYLNAALRLKDAKELTRLEQFISLMKSGLNKLPIYKGAVTRTIGMQVPQAAQRYRLGATVVEEAFTSTTFGKAVAQREGNILLTIESSTGRDITALAVHSESEILFAPGAKFVVTRVQQIGGAFLVWLKEVV